MSLLCKFVVLGTVATNGQVTQGKGCANTAFLLITNNCDDNYSVNNILMKNCGGYYVYYLKPTGNCNAAYCMK